METGGQARPGGALAILAHRPRLRRILLNSAWLSWDQLFRLAIGFVVGLWVARYLGVERWGTLTYSLAIVGLSVPLTTLGLDALMVRDLVLGRQRPAEIVGTGFLLKLAGAAVAGVASLALVLLLRPLDRQAWQLVAVVSLGMMFAPFDVISYWYMSRVESKYVVVAKTAAVTVAGAVRIAIILLRGSVLAFAAAIGLEYVLIAAGFVLVYQVKGQRVFRWRPRLQIAKRFLVEGWPLALSAVGVSLLLQANEVVIGQLSGVKEVGLYSAARRLCELWFFVPFAVSSSVQPALVALRNEDAARYREKITEVFAAVTAFALAVALGATLLAGPVVEVVFGAGFTQAAASLRAYVWVLPSFSVFVVQYPWDVNEGLTSQRLIRTLLGVAVLLILDVIMIPRMGASGAALSAVVAFAIAGIFGNLTSRGTREAFRLQVRSLGVLPARALRLARQARGDGRDF